MPAKTRVAFQGEHGAYSELACIALLGSDAETLPMQSFDDVFEAIENGDCEFGVVPLENSLAGSVHRNYDLLLKHDLHIRAEHVEQICHCLITQPGVKLSEIKRVYSHPQALAQCEHNLKHLEGVEPFVAEDTAGSVRMLKTEGWRDAAALAGKGAAELYGMQILDEHMEDDPSNFTRFVLLGRKPIEDPKDAKTSLAFAGQNEPGLLFQCIAAFALRGIDLTKIESRPLRGKPWQYVFYLDFEGSLAETRCQKALDQLEEMTTFVRVFGSYPRAKQPLSQA